MWVQLIERPHGRHAVGSIVNIGAGEAERLIKAGLASPVPYEVSKHLEAPPEDKMVRQPGRAK